MERLLAHPPSLPLRHVDHSHRLASPVPTGICRGVVNHNSILAKLIVNVTYEAGMTPHQQSFTLDYELGLLECPGYKKQLADSWADFEPGLPKVSGGSVRDIISKLIKAAQSALYRTHGYAEISAQKPGKRKQIEIGIVENDYRYINFNAEEFHGADAEVQKYLAEFYNYADFPSFTIACRAGDNPNRRRR